MMMKNLVTVPIMAIIIQQIILDIADDCNNKKNNNKTATITRQAM